MENLTELLKELSLSLGTTSEFLWAVLIKQAFISGVVNIIQYILIIISCLVWWFVCKKVSIKIKDSWEQENYIWLGIGWVFLFVIVVIAAFNLQNTVAAFINPEYWAFDYIMSSINENNLLN